MTRPSDNRDDRTRQPLPDPESGGLSGLPDSGDDPLGKIGTIIGGRFRIRGHVKGGGFAEVYHGFNVNLPDQRVIIKFLRDATLADRFGKEAQLLCRLDHPNICRVIDYLVDEHAIIVPFIDGKDCERILRSTGPLAPEMFSKVATTIVDALAFAHARKIAHRDIKPGNIMIDRHGIPYLIDFGIAKEIDVDSTSTRTGYVALTPQFAAPERQTGDTGYNPFLSDIYELGVTLCVMATGELPYHNSAYPSLRDWDRTFQRPLPPSLRDVLQKAAHPIPTERIQSVDELANMLRQVKMVAEPVKRPRVPWGIVGALGVVILGFLVWQFGPWSGERTPQSTSIPAESGRGDATIPPGPDTITPNDKSAAHSQSEPGSQEVKQAPAATLSQSQIRLEVHPREGSIALIDGVRQSLATEHPISQGVHRLRIMNAAYPILERSIRVAGRDTALVYDLAQEFDGRDSVDLRIALNPPSTEYELTVVLNGVSRTYSSFPVRDIKRLAGRWEIEMRLAAVGGATGQSRIDSTVTFPYGGGPHVAIKGARGEIDFGGEAWTDKRVVPLQVNWSVRQKK